MIKKISSILVASFLLLTFFGCEKLSSNKTIQIKAAIIYKMGGVQPVARTKFYLLNKSLAEIKKDVKGNSEPEEIPGMPLNYKSSYMRWLDSKEVQAAIEPHIVKTLTTDFEGTGKFEDVPAGTYYIFGVTETRGGFALWDTKIDTNSIKDTILLDQNNAEHAS